MDLNNKTKESKTRTVVKKIDNCVDEITNISKEFESYSQEAITYLGSTNGVIRKLQDYVEQIELLETTIEYIKISQKIENIR